jgi:hypothetical protein
MMNGTLYASVDGDGDKAVYGIDPATGAVSRAFSQDVQPDDEVEGLTAIPAAVVSAPNSSARRPSCPLRTRTACALAGCAYRSMDSRTPTTNGVRAVPSSPPRMTAAGLRQLTRSASTRPMVRPASMMTRAAAWSVSSSASGGISVVVLPVPDLSTWVS